jgi:hypothetical protein
MRVQNLNGEENQTKPVEEGLAPKREGKKRCIRSSLYGIVFGLEKKECSLGTKRCCFFTRKTKCNIAFLSIFPLS